MDSSTDRPNALDRAPSRATLERLAADGVLSEDAFHRACSLIEPDGWGIGWASRALLFFGAALGLAGVIFFFAFNWADLPDLVKLGLVEAGVVACLAGATVPALERLAPDKLSSRVLLVAASVLIGVFLAVFGQTYQTGADPWQLFAMWSLLMLPLVGLARSQGGWVVFGTVTSIALILFLEQRLYLGDYPQLPEHLYPAAVSLVCGTLWLVLEHWRDRRSPDWLDPPWARKLFAVAVFAGLASPEIFFSSSWPWHVLQLSALGAASLAVFSRYAYDEHDLGVIGIGGLTWLVIGVVRLGDWMFDVISSAALASLLMAAFTLAASGALVWGLRALADDAFADSEPADTEAPSSGETP